MKNPDLSKGILPYIPFFYVIWSDDLLSASETQIVTHAVENDDTLTPNDRSILKGWLDKKNPPDSKTLKSWQNLISHSQVTLNKSADFPLEDLSRKMTQFYTQSIVANKLLQHIEKHLGIQPNHYSHLFRIEIAQNTMASHYDASKLDGLLLGKLQEGITQFRTFLDQPLFDWKHFESKELHRKHTLRQVNELGNEGWGAWAYPKSNGGKEDLETYAGIFEHLIYVDASLAIKFGVQFGLFGGSIQNLGTTKHHNKYLTDAGNAALLGCFAMTETGHGSNVRGIKTTATYVHEDKVIIIHTPGHQDNKEYIGNALHSKIASVFAQLIVNGKNEGVHAILVPLRDENHNLLPGLKVEDNGHKLGLNGVDNGKIWFNQVKVPVENLLDKFGGIDKNGKYHSPIQNPNKRFFTMLGTLVGGRICVAKGALAAAKMALSIAVKHALKRRQFNNPEKIQEDLLIDYPSHQLRLIPKVASAYVYHFAIQRAMAEYAANTSEDKRKIETQVAGLKSLITWFATSAIQESREACGGKGYLTENRISELKNDADIFTTFEGDNTVLLLLAAKNVLSDFKSEFNSGGVSSVLKLLSSQLGDKISTLNPAYRNQVDSAHLYNPKFHLHALDFRLRKLTYSAAMRIRKYIKQGMPSYQAFLKTQTHLLELGKAYSQVLAIKWYYDAVNNLNCASEYLQLLYKIGALHSLSVIRAEAAWYLESDYLGDKKSKAIRQRVERLSSELRPDIGALVDGFGIPDRQNAAPIAG